MAKSKYLVTAAAAALLGLTAPALAQKPGGQLNIVVQPEPPGLMLGLVQNGPTQMVAGNIYESLLKYDKNLKPLPSLAESYTISEDGKVYTFQIKQGVTWHDGKPFSIDDVIFSLDKFLRETHPRWRPVANGQIDKIEKVDEKTLKISLKNPFGPFILMFEVGTTPIVPKHIYDGTDYKANPANNTPIGTGPFKFAEWNKGSFIKLVKNETYHVKGQPYLETLYWQIIPDAAARAVAYETGKIDVLTGGSVENADLERIKKVANTCMTTDGWELFAPLSWVWINNRKAPMDKKEFRQGIMYALDREFAKDVIWNGLGKVATGPVASATKFFTKDVPTYSYDPKKAKELIAKSGYKGEKITFLALPYGETWARWAEAIRQNLIEVGVNVDIVSTDVAGYNQRLSNWDYDLSMSYLYQYGDPAAGVARTYISSNIVKGNPFANVEGYSNPEVDKLFAEAATATPDSKRQELYTKVQKILVEDVPVAWQTEMQFPTIYKCNVKNLIKTAIGINDAFGDAWKE